MDIYIYASEKRPGCCADGTSSLPPIAQQLDRDGSSFLSAHLNRGERGGASVLCAFKRAYRWLIYCMCTHARVHRARMRVRVWIMSHMQHSRHCFPSHCTARRDRCGMLFWFSLREGQRGSNFVCFRTSTSAAECSSTTLLTVATVLLTRPSHCSCAD